MSALVDDGSHTAQLVLTSLQRSLQQTQFLPLVGFLSLTVCHFRLGLHFLCPLCKLHRRNSLFHCLRCDRTGDNHASDGVTHEGLFEDTGQFGLAPWDVVAVLYQGADGVAEATQGKVDLFCLLQSLSFDLALKDLLTAGKVDQVELATDLFASFDFPSEVKGEDDV